MATKNNYAQDLKELEEQRGAILRKRRIECDHSVGQLVPLSQYSGVIRNRQDYPDTALICPECGAIFDSRMLTPVEVDNAFYLIESMAHQIAVLTNGNLEKSKRDELTNCLEAIDSVKANLVPYYNSMTKALSNQDKQQQQRNRQVGGIGINPAMYGGRR